MVEDGNEQIKIIETEESAARTSGKISFGCGILLWVTIFYFSVNFNYLSYGMATFIYYVKLLAPWIGAGTGLYAVLNGAHRRATAWIGLLLAGVYLAILADIYT